MESTYVGESSFEARNSKLKELATSAGIRLPETRVPEGDSLLPIGEENKRKLQCEIAALPDVEVAIGALRERIAAESAKDTQIPIARMRMSPENAGLFGIGPNGQPAHPEVPPLGYTPAGFTHVVDAIKPPTLSSGAVGGTLLALPPKLRADVFNEFAGRKVEQEDRVIRTIVDPRSKRRVVRAMTSQRHSLETGDDTAVLDALSEGSGPLASLQGAKMRVTRALDRTDLEILWPAMERQIKVGDVVIIGARVSNSETKAGSLRVEACLLRALCYNFTTAWSIDENDEEIMLRHVGDLRRKVPQALARALARIEPFVKAFADAYKNALPAAYPTRGEALERTRRAFALPAHLVESASQLWDADGADSGDTLASLVNALTRASQQQGMAQASETERVAGRLIAQGWSALS